MLWKLFYEQHPFENFVPIDNPGMEGWHVPDPIYELAIASSNAKLAIEIGSWKGASAITIMNYMIEQGWSSFPQIICIDTWLGGVEHWKLPSSGNNAYEWLKIRHGRPEFYYDFMTNIFNAGLKDHVLPLPQTSENAAKMLTERNIKADLVYVDGSHEYGDALSDMLTYWKLLNEGGIMLGDDLPIQSVERAFESFKAIVRVKPFYTDGNFFMFEKGSEDA